MRILIVLCGLVCLPLIAHAHQTSTSFLNIEESGVKTTLQWKASLNSLNTIKSLDQNNDGNITWSEVKFNKESILQIFNRSVSINSNQSICLLKNNKMAIENILDKPYINLTFETGCKMVDIKSVNYNYYFLLDNDHKAIINIDSKANNLYMLSASNTILNLQGKNKTFLNMVKEGVWHILIGFDHIVFILTLIIGVMFSHVLANKNIRNNKQNFKEILKVVTAFTLAHSITLGLASLKVIVLPIQIVEILIAVTLIFAAMQNVKHVLPKQFSILFSLPIWKMAFIFGLIHGFGFANVLAELNLSSSNIAFTLFAFNLGVEIGQVVIVLLFIALMGVVILNKSHKNNQLARVLPISSTFVIFLGSVWIVERSFNIAVF